MAGTRKRPAAAAPGGWRQSGRESQPGHVKGNKAGAEASTSAAAPTQRPAPPPGLGLAVESAEQSAEEAFAKSLQERPLPPSLAGDACRLERFESALLSCVEGLYRDRIATTLGEVQDRLRSCGWHSPAELAAAFPLGARKPECFKLVPPSEGEPPRILLRALPPWFAGFQDLDSASDTYPPATWKALQHILKEPGLPALRGGAMKAALCLQRWGGLPESLRCLPLGELRHVLQLALGPRRLLRFVSKNGGLLEVRGAEESEAAVSCQGEGGMMVIGRMKEEAEATRLTSFLAAQQLPRSWATRGGAERWELRRSLQLCIEGLHHKRVEPTLREVQETLVREHGWDLQEAQAAAMICAREPDTYVVVPPAEGKPARIQLRSSPQGFCGFVPNTEGGPGPWPQPRPPAEAWEALGSVLSTATPVPTGGIDGVALSLRQNKLPELRGMSPGELRDLVRRAVAEKGMLAYAGSDLEPSQAWSGKPAADGRIYSQI